MKHNYAPGVKSHPPREYCHTPDKRESSMEGVLSEEENHSTDTGKTQLLLVKTNNCFYQM